MKEGKEGRKRKKRERKGRLAILVFKVANELLDICITNFGVLMEILCYHTLKTQISPHSAKKKGGETSK